MINKRMAYIPKHYPMDWVSAPSTGHRFDGIVWPMPPAAPTRVPRIESIINLYTEKTDAHQTASVDSRPRPNSDSSSFGDIQIRLSCLETRPSLPHSTQLSPTPSPHTTQPDPIFREWQSPVYEPDRVRLSLLPSEKPTRPKRPAPLNLRPSLPPVDVEWMGSVGSPAKLDLHLTDPQLDFPSEWSASREAKNTTHSAGTSANHRAGHCYYAGGRETSGCRANHSAGSTENAPASSGRSSSRTRSLREWMPGRRYRDSIQQSLSDAYTGIQRRISITVSRSSRDRAPSVSSCYSNSGPSLTPTFSVDHSRHPSSTTTVSSKWLQTTAPASPASPPAETRNDLSFGRKLTLAMQHATGQSPGAERLGRRQVRQRKKHADLREELKKKIVVIGQARV